MSNWVWRRIKAWEKRYRGTYSHDIVDPEERRKSQFYMDWVDHGILRRRWHNFDEIAPGLYRANHPDHARFKAYKARGITTILNLRGASHHSHYKFEVESCAALGLDLIDLPMSARRVPPVARLVEVMDVLDALTGPTLMHCKSGADRTGLVSAVYYLHNLGRAPDEARKMLSINYLHLKFTSTGIQDYVIDMYARRAAQGPISFRDWVTSEYDPDQAVREFAELGFWGRMRL